MNRIESKILNDWFISAPHTSTWGGSPRGRVFVIPRDEVRVEPSGNRLYRLWGTNLCHKSDRGIFYFHVTDTGNSKSNTCMSHTSESRINVLLPYGHITQKAWHNYYENVIHVNDKPCKTVTKLECGYWYKVFNGKVTKIKGLPISLTD